MTGNAGAIFPCRNDPATIGSEHDALEGPPIYTPLPTPDPAGGPGSAVHALNLHAAGLTRRFRP